MPAGLNNIKNRINSTKNSKKITSAMHLVASSKMKSFQNKAISARNYSEDLIDIMLKTTDMSLDNVYTKSNENGDKIFILYTSDKGLCGNLNTKLLNALFTSDDWIKTNPNNRKLITIGKKGIDYANFNNIPIYKSYHSLDENIDYITTVDIIDDILEVWSKEDIYEIKIVSPYYKNTLVTYPILKTLLPIDIIIQNNTDNSNTIESIPEFEPSQELFYESIIENMIFSKFLESFLQLKASEYSNRMIAMKNATDSAEDIIEDLSLKFNKLRQGAITQEIMEIMSGTLV